MVSPYPPRHDGLAQYAVQEVRELRRDGHEVEVLSPEPSAAHHHLDLLHPRGLLALAKRSRRYDRVIVQYHPALFYREPVTPNERSRVALGMLAVGRCARDLELRIHEFDYEGAHGTTLDARLTREMWRSAGRITVHTEFERKRFAEAFEVPPERISVFEHGTHFVKRTSLDRDGARRVLGLPDDATIFLSIGFIQPSKGFDRAVRAFGDLGSHGCRLHVVGSVRTDDFDHGGYLEDLRRTVDATAGAHLHEGYVSDERFDAWIVASDYVVVPYRLIWSSGVVERARLYARPIVATRVGGLAEQVPPGSILVDGDAELAAALRRVAGVTAGASVAGSPSWLGDGPADQAAVMAEVRARAAGIRGSGPQRAGATPSGSRSAPVRRLAPLELPPAVSVRPGVTVVKRAVRKLTAWMIDPIVGQTNQMRRAVIEALEDDGTDHADTPRGASPGHHGAPQG
jgi:glycosyltransferase involved in cell wall biosynthesis